MSIPHIFHTVRWAQLPSSLLQQRCSQSWFHHLSPPDGPEWGYRYWGEDGVRSSTEPGVCFNWEQTLTSKYTNWLHKAKPANATNLLRMFAVYTMGGIYLDNDVEVLKPLHPIADAHKVFFGFQQDTTEGDTINNAIFGAESGNPLILEIMEQIVATDPRGCAARSGPGIVTRVINPFGPLIEQDITRKGTTVHLFPKEVFYPFRWNQVPSRKYITERTMAIHWWEGSWLPSGKHFPEAIGHFVEDNQ